MQKVIIIIFKKKKQCTICEKNNDEAIESKIVQLSNRNVNRPLKKYHLFSNYIYPLPLKV